MTKKLFLWAGLFLAAAAHAQQPTTTGEVVKTDAEWKQQLTPAQYTVLREKGTEKANSGQYIKTFDKGTYTCSACGNPIFESDTKFKSDCGYATFDKAIRNAIMFEADYSTGELRTGVDCAKCGGHLGHVYDDGPAATTGKRFAMNSVALKFVAEKK